VLVAITRVHLLFVFDCAKSKLTLSAKGSFVRTNMVMVHLLLPMLINEVTWVGDFSRSFHIEFNAGTRIAGYLILMENRGFALKEAPVGLVEE